MDSASTKQIVAYWLCPAELARTHFVAIINDLAAKFDAPAFEPHVTLYVTDAPNEKPDAVLEHVLKSYGHARLSIHGLDYSDQFTKTLFVEFKPDAELARLSSDLRRASAVQNDYELNPHLSLIYKTMAEETKRDLANSVRLPFTEVRFDSVKAVISPANIESRADVEAWRVVAEQELTG
jgi:2'-5' RNA ligase